jgi:TonB family protein
MRVDLPAPLGPMRIVTRPVSISSDIASTRALVAQINRFKRFPPDAASGGTVSVALTINRAGSVVSARLIAPSGDRALEEEAVALLHRASPVPQPPAQFGGSVISLTVPVRFRQISAARRRGPRSLNRSRAACRLQARRQNGRADPERARPISDDQPRMGAEAEGFSKRADVGIPDRAGAGLSPREISVSEHLPLGDPPPSEGGEEDRAPIERSAPVVPFIRASRHREAGQGRGGEVRRGRPSAGLIKVNARLERLTH